MSLPKPKLLHLLLLLGILLNTTPPTYATTCDPDATRTDCGYVGITQQQCIDKGCCWSPASAARGDIPWCFTASNPIPGYSVVSQSLVPDGSGMDVLLKLIGSSHVFSSAGDVTELAVQVRFQSADQLRVRIYDPNHKRWEIPETFLPADTEQQFQGTTNYKFSYTQAPFTFAVTRTSDGQVLFNSSSPRSLIFQDQYLELGTQIPQNANIYGLGERVDSFRLETNGKTYTMWSLDSGTPPNQNLYGVHPFYMELRDGKAHGVFLRNSNGMEVTLKNTLATYHVIGGVLDFYFFVGPTPKQVIQQYHALIGKPYFTPLWSLGWHQCRWGTKNINELKTVVDKYSSNGIPLDTVWSDIDYMDSHRDFSWDPINFPQSQMKQFADDLHSKGQRYVVIVDPGIPSVQGYFPYDEGVRQNIFLKTASGDVFVGKVWPGYTAFPDFSHPNSTNYWKQLVSEFLDGVKIDGLWIDMNEPSNFCDGACQISNQVSSGPADPPYAINNGGNKWSLKTKTLDMDVTHFAGIEYDMHSMYGFLETIATKEVLESITGKRAFVLSRSTFAGSGKHGAHWLGDNYSTWESMKAAIPGALLMNMFGIPMVGADICGFVFTATEELCVRWHAMGAFFPFARNHDEINAADQYPYLWPSVQKIAIKALNARYSILPYYYTLFYEAHKNGGAVMRSLMLNFPEDPTVVAIETQFMIGDAVLVSPCLDVTKTVVSAYFPDAVWYDFWTGTKTSFRMQWQTLDTPWDVIPVHIKGGSVIPQKQPRTTVTATMLNEFEILIALDETGSAQGSLYIDNGEQLDVDAGISYFNFVVDQGKLRTVVVENGYSGSEVNLFVSKVTVWGVSSVSSVKVGDVDVEPALVNFNKESELLAIDVSPLKLTVKDLIVSW